MRKVIKAIPIVGPILASLKRSFSTRETTIASSKDYWEQRYKNGGNSGLGSYEKLAEFKSQVINDFVKRNNVLSVIEFGCGDGNQLRLANYSSYIGFDVSEKAISICKEMFKSDKTKQFYLLENAKGETSQMTMSLDVIYHLLEDTIFNDYMSRLFDSSDEFVVIYSSNTNEPILPIGPHVRHRKFSEWIKHKRPNWTLIHHIPNKYPYNGNNSEGSFADFYIYKKN